MSIFRLFIFIALAQLMVTGCTHTSVAPDTVEASKIESVLMKYINGTSEGRPDLLREAFHPDFNLYARNQDDTLKVWKGEDYISLFEVPQTRNRVGSIISIDQEQDVAVAKVEIEVAGRRLFTDYFLLVKYSGHWKIIHKSYTSREIEK